MDNRVQGEEGQVVMARIPSVKSQAKGAFPDILPPAWTSAELTSKCHCPGTMPLCKVWGTPLAFGPLLPCQKGMACSAIGDEKETDRCYGESTGPPGKA